MILGRGRDAAPSCGLVERIGFLKLQVGRGLVLQSNVWAARRIYETVLEWAAPSGADQALDLFRGIGLLSSTWW